MDTAELTLWENMENCDVGGGFIFCWPSHFEHSMKSNLLIIPAYKV